MQRIPLTHGKFALVDDEHYTLVSWRKWHAREFNGVWYARTNVTLPSGRKTILDMHRFLMSAQHGQRVDHADGDGLNNTSANLRFCTHSQNMRNRRNRFQAKTSRFHGVSRRTPDGTRWVAQIQAEKLRPRCIGVFNDEESAARAYDREAIKYFGEFARTNFPKEQYA